MEATVYGFIFLTVISYVTAGPELQITPGNDIKQGDTVTIRCSTSDAGEFVVNRLTRKLDGVSYPIAINNVIKAPFTGDPRYRRVSEAQSNKLSEIVIDDIQGRDSGVITCNEMGMVDMEVTQHLHVIVPPTQVQLHHGSVELQDGDVMTLTSSYRHGNFACFVEVDGDDAAPHVSVVLDGQDITASMSEESTTEEDVSEATRGYSGGAYAAFYQTSSTSPQLYDIAYHGATLTCTAHNAPFPALSKSVTLNIHHGPTEAEHCSPTQHYQLGDEMELMCKVRMYPAPSVQRWMWGDAGDYVQADGAADDDVTLGGRLSTVVTKEGEHDYTYVLRLAGVREGDPLGQFTLQLENEHSSKAIVIKLDQRHVETTKPPPTYAVVTNPPATEKVLTDNSLGSGSATASLSACVILLSLIFARFC